MTVKQNKDYADLREALRAQGGNYDEEKISRAFEYCVTMHAGQKRWTNEEYYIHPVSVAKILVSLGMDTESIVAALLHDVVEDT